MIQGNKIGSTSEFQPAVDSRAMRLMISALLTLLSTSAFASVPATQDACAPVPDRYVGQGNGPGGTTCLYGADCLSGMCLPDGRGGAYCAGEGRIQWDCLFSYGPDWRLTNLDLCESDSATCGASTRPFCVYDLGGTSSCAGACTAGESCLWNEDCGGSEGVCIRDPNANSGQCAAGFPGRPDGLCPAGFECSDDPNTSARWCTIPDTGVVQNPILNGAVCDGVHNDGPQLQAQLNHISSQGGGTLYLPACTFFIDQTLHIHDNTTIVGHGAQSLLIRGDAETSSPLWEISDCAGNVASQSFPNWGFLRNARYNCDNTNIVLQDFALDGSLVQGSQTDPQGLHAPAIQFSGVTDSIIERLTIRDVAQDAIFLRNGGINVVVRDNLIDGFNMRWFNGAAINVEMHADGINPGQPLITNNSIISRSLKPTSNQIFGINVSRNGVATAPRVIITNNVIRLRDGHSGISVLDFAEDSLVQNNTLLAWPSPENTAFKGIHVMGDVDVIGNHITGGEKATVHRAIYAEGPAISPFGPITVSHNTIVGWSLVSSDPATKASIGIISLKGYRDFTMIGNNVSNPAGGHVLSLGYTELEPSSHLARNGLIQDNVFPDPSGGYNSIDCKPKSCEMSLVNNVAPIVTVTECTKPCP